MKHKIWKELGIFFICSQIISFVCLWQSRNYMETLNSPWNVLVQALPTNLLFWYILILLYRIVFRNIDFVKYLPQKTEIIFYLDFIPKFVMTVLAALFFNRTIKMESNVATFLLLIIMLLDITFEIIIVADFRKVECSDYTKRKDRTIPVQPKICTKEIYENANRALGLSVIMNILPFGYYLFWNKGFFDATQYFLFTFAVNYWGYVTLKTKYSHLFAKKNYIFRAFLVESIVYIGMFLICLSDASEPVSMNFIIIVSIALNKYWFESITYQIVKSLREMELYLKENSVEEKK